MKGEMLWRYDRPPVVRWRLLGEIRESLGVYPPVNPQTAQDALDELAGMGDRVTPRGERLYEVLTTTVLGCGGHLVGWWNPPGEPHPLVVVSWTPFTWRRLLLTNHGLFPEPDDQGFVRELVVYLDRWGCRPFSGRTDALHRADTTLLVGTG